MEIISYSDLHLEFGSRLKPPPSSFADVMVLAGDILHLKDYRPLDIFLEDWDKPVLYVMGNHEYYTHKTMGKTIGRFKDWLVHKHPNVHLLQDEGVTINNAHFFGGTMWTDFAQSNKESMIYAHLRRGDYRHIYTRPHLLLKPEDTVIFHQNFIRKLIDWFNQTLIGPRVVISHHVPSLSLTIRHKNSPVLPAFAASDVERLIEMFQPDLWIYGHIHENQDCFLGKTRLIANQLGYKTKTGAFECADFDPTGKKIVLNDA